ncbi:EAL domain-containing protein [Marinobacter sp.]|uniref:EAL domain-containing protein n=1 Tax=Marinobacter sp. TaxID=50741 RepID=UPI003564AFB6
MNRTSECHTDSASQAPSPLIAVMVDQITGLSFQEHLTSYSCIETDIQALGNTPFNLAIFDVATLARYENEVRDIRLMTGPLAVPILLLVSSEELPTAGRFIGNLADDVIRTPISTIELKARIDSLVRLTQLAANPGQTPKMPPAQSTNALQALIACNERIVSACTEQDVLSGICKSLTREGGYPLAWVGKKPDKDIRSIRPIAISGIANNPGSITGEDTFTQLMEHTFESGRRFLDNQQPAANQIESGVASTDRYAVIAFPLTKAEEGADTCLAVYSHSPGGFDNREIDLLQQMVDYAVYAIEALREKSRRIRSEQEAERVAYRDLLTGLANRRAAIETLNQHLRSTGPHAPATGLLCLDLDGFKLINDTLGHDIGDQVLREVGSRLQAAVRERDLVARQGGDEFIIVALHDDGFSKPAHLRSTMARLAHRVLESIETPIPIRGRDYRIEASIGISLCPLHGKDALSLLIKADSAMYEAKKLGGNSFQFFSCEQSERQQHRLELGNRLYRASEAKAFQLAFQPIVDLTNGHITGAEALLRWPQSDGANLSPTEFIPIAEETGLIVSIGEWVIDESLNAARRLRDQGFQDFRIAINLAISQLWQSQLVEKILARLHSLDLPPATLTVELTESSLMSDVDRMEGVVNEFRAAGIGVAIDDFGTGFSSLARLRSLPINTLKIDRSFLMGTPGNENAVNMVRAIAHMAESFGIPCVAEGIETEEQWRLLRGLGCQFGQGFYFARPMPEADLLALLARQESANRRSS